MPERINAHDLAVRITAAEGGAVNLTIAQVKEVQRCLLRELALQPEASVLELVRRYRPKRAKGR